MDYYLNAQLFSMKTISLSFFFFLGITSLIAQKLPIDTPLQNLSKVELGFQGVGYAYELGLSRDFAIDFASGFGWGHSINEGELVYCLNLLNPSIYLTANPKLFYNRKRRIENGKSIRLNSGNYFGLLVKMTTPKIFSSAPDILIDPNESRFSLLTNIHWGMQRALGSRWLFNGHLGLGIASDLKYGYRLGYPALNLKFSYLINHKR